MLDFSNQVKRQDSCKYLLEPQHLQAEIRGWLGSRQMRHSAWAFGVGSGGSGGSGVFLVGLRHLLVGFVKMSSRWLVRERLLGYC